MYGFNCPQTVKVKKEGWDQYEITAFYKMRLEWKEKILIQQFKNLGPAFNKIWLK